jgi:hypothetical protein
MRRAAATAVRRAAATAVRLAAAAAAAAVQLKGTTTDQRLVGVAGTDTLDRPREHAGLLQK